MDRLGFIKNNVPPPQVTGWRERTLMEPPALLVPGPLTEQQAREADLFASLLSMDRNHH